MNPIRCPNCDWQLTPGEINEGWCEECGKKVPSAVLAAASANHPSEEPVDPAGNVAESTEVSLQRNARAWALKMLQAGTSPSEVENQLFERGLNRKTADRVIADASTEMANAPRPIGHFVRVAGRRLARVTALVLCLPTWAITIAYLKLGEFPPWWVVALWVLLGACVLVWVGSGKAAPPSFWRSVGGGWWYLRSANGSVVVWREQWGGTREENHVVIPLSDDAFRVIRTCEQDGIGNDQFLRQCFEENVRQP